MSRAARRSWASDPYLLWVTVASLAAFGIGMTNPHAAGERPAGSAGYASPEKTTARALAASETGGGAWIGLTEASAAKRAFPGSLVTVATEERGPGAGSVFVSSRETASAY